MSQSVWAKNIVYKGPADKKRSALFTRMARLITVATREGGGDPAFNFKLRSAIDRALDNNMPKDSIERAVKKGTGELASEQIEEVLYEGYGPGGVAVIVEALTDNRNRTAANIKHAFSVSGGSLGSTGSVQWMFMRKGAIRLKTSAVSDETQLALIDAGADDFASGGDETTVFCAPDALGKVRDAAVAAGFAVASAGFEWSAKERAASPDEETLKQVESMLERLDADEDVSEVYTTLGA